MAKMTKKKRSAAGRKAAKTRKANKAKRSRAAKKGATHRKGTTGRRKKWGSPKQRAALKKMQAARGTGGVRRRRGKKSRAIRVRATVVGGGNHEARITALENVTVRVVLPAVAHVYRSQGLGMPRIAGPGYARLGAGR